MKDHEYVVKREVSEKIKNIVDLDLLKYVLCIHNTQVKLTIHINSIIHNCKDLSKRTD